MSSAARSAAAKKAAETRKQRLLLKGAADTAPLSSVLCRPRVQEGPPPPAAAAGSAAQSEEHFAPLPPASAGASGVRAPAASGPEGPAEAPRPAPAASLPEAAVAGGTIVPAQGLRAKVWFEDSGVARPARGRAGGERAPPSPPEEDGDSEEDIWGPGLARKPCEPPPGQDEWPCCEGASVADPSGVGPSTPPEKRARRGGSGVDDITRASAQKTPGPGTVAKAKAEQKKAGESSEALEKRACKLLEERFRDFGKVKDIKTLSDRAGGLLWDAVLAVRAATSRLQDAQVRDLRKRFAPPGTAEHDLRIRFPEDEVDPALLAAIRLSKDPSLEKRSNGDFVAYMSECEGLNQKELVICLRDVAGNNPLVQPARQEYVSALMECIVRCRLDERHPREVALLHTVWDDSLQVIFSSFSKRKNPFADFWANYPPHCRLAMDPADAETAARCTEESAEKVLPACVRLLNSSHLGRALFQDVARKGAEGYLKQLMTTVLEGIQPPITQRKINVANGKIRAEMERLKVHVLLSGKRLVVVVYRREPVKCIVASAEEEWTFVRAAFLKNHALECGALHPTSLEEALVPLPEPDGGPPSRRLELSLVSGFQLANSHVDACVEKSKKKDAESLLKVIEAQAPKWKVHDRSFVLQLGWLQAQAAGKARATFEETVLLALSLPKIREGYEGVLGRLAELKEDDLTLFCGLGAEDDLRKITTLVGALYHGKSVADVSPHQASPFRRQALGAIEHFCSCTLCDESGAEVSKLTGRPAMQALYAEFERALQAGELRTGALKPFHTFKWMLSGDQQSAVQDARNACLRESLQASGALVSADAEIPEAVAEDAGPRAKKAKKSSAAALVDAELEDLMS